MSTFPRPVETEHAPYYSKYTMLVPDGDIVEILAGQMHKALAEYAKVGEEKAMTAYAPGKWTLKEAFQHVIDTERVFTFRALWFARNAVSELPSMDQDAFVPESGANSRSWGSLLEEYSQVRESTLALFRGLPPVAWVRHGVASGNPVSVRALAFIIAGHELHHLNILKEHYQVA
mgnify:CR=1 FL=1